MALRIELNGYLVPFSEHSSIDDVSVTLRWRDDEGDVAYGFSGTVDFFGEAYNIIRRSIILSPQFRTEYVHVRVYDDCCNNVQIFEGKITYSQVDWCEKDCSVSCTIVQFDEKSKVIDCLKSKMIWEDKAYELWYNTYVKNNPSFRAYASRVASDFDYDRYKSMDHSRVVADIISRAPYNYIPPAPTNTFLTKPHPFFRYCVETRPHTMLDIAAVLTILIATLDLITLGASILSPFAELMRYWVIDCDKGHAAPFIRDYLRNGCNLCGLNFQSPIFENVSSPYYNTTMLYAPVAQGNFWRVSSPGNPGYNVLNRPVMSVYQLLERLKDTFNGEYRVMGNTLLFDRRDKVFPPSLWKDFTDVTDPNLIELCYEYGKEELPAYAQFSWSKDMEDEIGNEAKPLYEDIVEYNPNNSFPWLKGGKTYTIPFGMARFRDDNLSYDPITYWAEGPSGLVFPGGSRIPYDNMLIMKNGKCSEPKLLIWDGVSSFDNAKVIRKRIPNLGSKFYYNYPLYFGESGDSLSSGKPSYNEIAGNLYDRFWYINDSRTVASRQMKYKLVFIRNCEDIANFDFGKKIKLPLGEGNIDTITIKSTEIEVTGTI